MGDAIKLGDAGEYVTVSKRESKHDGMNVDVYSMRIEGANDQHTDFWNLYDWQVQFIVDELNKVDNLTNQLTSANEKVRHYITKVDDLTKQLAELEANLEAANERARHYITKSDDLTKQLQWISVDERLPEEDGRYLVTDGSLWNEIVYFDVDRYWSEYDSIVTHWMAIRALPDSEVTG